MKTKAKLIGCIIVLSVIMMYIPTRSKAGLQANGESVKQDSINNWLLNVRQMESSGGTLGLTDSINQTNLTSSAETSNNLDIHMEKNTEYGAMAILSASSYGKPDKVNDGETTTGNKSGIYININKEWVAAGALTELSRYVNANPRYKNYYTNSYVAKYGDAIEETKGWHGSGASTWLIANGDYNGGNNNPNAKSGLLRAYSGSIFSYFGQGWRLRRLSWFACTSILCKSLGNPCSSCYRRRNLRIKN